MKLPSTRSWLSAAIALIVIGVILLAVSGILQPMFNNALGPFVTVEKWISIRANALFELFTVPRDVASLRQRNAELEAQVAKFQSQVVILEQQLREAQVLYALLDFARARPENQYIASTVIGRDPSPFLHYVFIDHGSDDGIRHGMPIATENGLVGRIDAVSSNAARIQLITDPGSVINIRLKNAKVDAQMVGSTTGDLTLEMIPQDAQIEIGDLVLTSGLGGSYPADILIGQITSVRKRDTDLFQTAIVQPAVDFTNLQAILVITNFKPVDIGPLTPSLTP
ncbi:MAG: rod shape-determining protein MreC [Anaerolineaceae bacterium]|nr:rod shape-determining protein MreC [Anaerolineaceae bacterium]